VFLGNTQYYKTLDTNTEYRVQINIYFYFFLIAHNQIKQYYRPQIIAFKLDFIHR
jgi:hypothetical protein